MAPLRVSLAALVLSFASGCGNNDRLPALPVDCSVEEKYEFSNISNFSGSDSGWFRYADPTPGSTPNIIRGSTDPATGSNVPVTDIEPPGRCGDTRMIKLEVEGKNFWGAGFGDWAHNHLANRANGAGYEGISFWARSPINAEKQFLFRVDDSRTILLTPESDAGPPVATPDDEDLDGDGYVGPGDIARETRCRIPPPPEIAQVNCYKGGLEAPPSSAVRVPESNECGNAFHTRITTTETWQLFTIPWKELVQWPCPNRLAGGIDETDIAKFEIILLQGMHYEIWLDNIAFYRARAD